MTEGNISGTDWKNSYYCIYCPDMLKTYQRVTETKLFESSRNSNWEELKDKTTSLCNGFTLQGFAFQWLHFAMARCYFAMAFEIAICKYFMNKNLYFRFPFSRLPMFTKLPPFLTTSDTWKYRRIVKDFYATENAALALAVQIFS